MGSYQAKSMVAASGYSAIEAMRLVDGVLANYIHSLGPADDAGWEDAQAMVQHMRDARTSLTQAAELSGTGDYFLAAARLRSCLMSLETVLEWLDAWAESEYKTQLTTARTLIDSAYAEIDLVLMQYPSGS